MSIRRRQTHTRQGRERTLRPRRCLENQRAPALMDVKPCSEMISVFVFTMGQNEAYGVGL